MRPFSRCSYRGSVLLRRPNRLVDKYIGAMKKTSTVSIIVMLVVVGLIGFIFVSQKGKAATGADSTTVKVIEAQFGDSGQSVMAPGTIVPAKVTDVSMLPGFSGKVTLVNAEVGTHVNKGDVLI